MEMDSPGEYTLGIMREAGWYNQWLFSLIYSYLGGEMLEVGSGIGNFTCLLKKRGALTAIDYDRYYLKKLTKRFAKDVSVGYGDIAKGEYFFGKRKRFDCIICLNVLEHVKDDAKALKNTYALLKKGGKLLLLVPAHQWVFGTLDRELGHITRYSKKDLKVKLGKTGFRISLIRYLNFIGLWGWFLSSKVFRKKVISQNQLRIFNVISKPFLFLEECIKLPMGLSVLAVGEKK